MIPDPAYTRVGPLASFVSSQTETIQTPEQYSRQFLNFCPWTKISRGNLECLASPLDSLRSENNPKITFLLPIKFPVLPLGGGKWCSESHGSAASEPGLAPSAAASPPVGKPEG